MTFRDAKLEELKLPSRFRVGAAIGLATVIALTLLLTDRREGLGEAAYGPLRGGFDTAIAPAAAALAAPPRWTGSLYDQARNYVYAGEQNAELRRLAAEGRDWRDAAIALREQNSRLAGLLRLRVEPPVASVAARAVTDSRGPFSQARLIDAGRDAGVRIGNPALGEHGLIGRVVGVARGVSRVLMLTDAASRVPVAIVRTDARAILAGDASDLPRLDYLRGQSPVREGDRIITSGDGGLFPRGLPVGVVVRVGDGWRVRLFSDRAPISFVRVLLYQDFTRLDAQPELNAPTPLTGVGQPPVAAPAPPRAGAAPPAR